MARVHEETMRLLEEVGCEFRDDEAVAMWRDAGADVDGQRVRFDRDLLMGLISTAPEHYTMLARNPDRSVTVGGRKTIFTPSYGAPFILDFDGNRRNATQEDFDNFAKIAYQQPAVHMTGGVLCEPMDIPVPHRHLEMTYSLLKHSDKPFMGAVTSRERAEDSMHMAGIVFGHDVVENTTVMTFVGQLQLAAAVGQDHARCSQGLRRKQSGHVVQPVCARRSLDPRRARLDRSCNLRPNHSPALRSANWSDQGPRLSLVSGCRRCR